MLEDREREPRVKARTNYRVTDLLWQKREDVDSILDKYQENFGTASEALVVVHECSTRL